MVSPDAESDDGWITPDNVHRLKKGLSLTDKLEFEQETEEDVEESTVACITGDFAMQVKQLPSVTRGLCYAGKAAS